MYWGETRKAHAAAQVADDGDGSFVIEGALNTACRSPIPHKPHFHHKQLSSCPLVHVFINCQNSDGAMRMVKRHQALV